jgi:hypothetical protein
MAVTVALTIQGLLDYIAKVRQNSLANVSDPIGLWTIVDACGDPPFENRVKGSYIYDADTALATGAVWSAPALKKVFSLIQDYCRIEGGKSVPYIGNYLASLGIRAPWEAAEALSEAGITRLLTTLVGAKGTKPANEANPADADDPSGMHKFGYYTPSAAAVGAWTEVDGELLITRLKGAPVVAINLVNGYSGANQYTQMVLGKADVTSGAAAGAVSVASTGISAAGNIIEGEYALIYESDDLQEIVLVGAVGAHTMAVAAPGIKNTYTTGADIYPLYTDAVVQSISGSNGNNIIDFYALPDRIISLT